MSTSSVRLMVGVWAAVLATVVEVCGVTAAGSLAAHARPVPSAQYQLVSSSNAASVW